ncbi:MAG TPA: hypothetical protein VG734_25490 [Lacunisphaera sp.]|nr:hypothetical protein [Lacunisphaera sp.]
MATLHVYEVHCGEGKDWFIAKSDNDCLRLMNRDRSMLPGDHATYFITRLPDAKKFSIPCNRKGELVDYHSSRKKTLTCGEWAKLRGRGYLCSEDY